MQANSLVECKKGHSGIIEKGEIYTVAHVLESGNLLLCEVSPPNPHTSFHKDRFIEVQGPMDVNAIVEECVNVQTW